MHVVSFSLKCQDKATLQSSSFPQDTKSPCFYSLRMIFKEYKQKALEF